MKKGHLKSKFETVRVDKKPLVRLELKKDYSEPTP